MRKLKENKAITLIALVITIIVLLILAGITIGQLQNSGLFSKTQVAKEEYVNAQEREDDILKQYENAISTGNVASDRNYTPINYSTNEQDTGKKWIDGSTIYSKLIDMGYSYKIDTATTTLSTNILPANIDMPINACFYIIDSANDLKAQDYCVINRAGNDFGYAANQLWYDAPTRHVYLYLEYTKKTTNNN